MDWDFLASNRSAQSVALNSVPALLLCLLAAVYAGFYLLSVVFLGPFTPAETLEVSDAVRLQISTDCLALWWTGGLRRAEDLALLFGLASLRAAVSTLTAKTRSAAVANHSGSAPLWVALGLAAASLRLAVDFLRPAVTPHCEAARFELRLAAAALASAGLRLAEVSLPRLAESPRARLAFKAARLGLLAGGLAGFIDSEAEGALLAAAALRATSPALKVAKRFSGLLRAIGDLAFVSQTQSAEGGVCSICLAQIDEGRSLSCGHAFHSDCLG